MITHRYYDFLGLRSNGHSYQKDVKVYARCPQEALQYYLHRKELPRKKDLPVIAKYCNILRVYEYTEVNKGRRGRTIKQFKKTDEWHILDIPLIKSKRI